MLIVEIVVFQWFPGLLQDFMALAFNIEWSVRWHSWFCYKSKGKKEGVSAWRSFGLKRQRVKALDQPRQSLESNKKQLFEYAWLAYSIACHSISTFAFEFYFWPLRLVLRGASKGILSLRTHRPAPSVHMGGFKEAALALQPYHCVPMAFISLFKFKSSSELWPHSQTLFSIASPL